MVGRGGVAALGVAAAVGGTTLRRKCSPYNSTSKAVFLSCLNVDSSLSGTKQRRALVAIPEIPRTGALSRGLDTVRGACPLTVPLLQFSSQP